jgi:hypothetical protein
LGAKVRFIDPEEFPATVGEGHLIVPAEKAGGFGRRIAAADHRKPPAERRRLGQAEMNPSLDLWGIA